MTWDWHYAFQILPDLLAGLKYTLIATLGGSAVALTLGLFLAILRVSGLPVVTQLSWSIVQLIRGTPLLIQLYFAYFVLPNYGITWSPLLLGILVLGINTSAYAAEVYRAGIQGVPRAQIEACTALNLSTIRKWTSVIIPQTIPLVIPPLGSYVVSMFKESAMLSTITVTELLSQAEAVGTLNFRYVEPLTIAGLMYLAITIPSVRGIRWLETRLRYVR